jgi:hypothetical protein
MVQSQPGQRVLKILSWKNITKKGWQSSSRCRPWVQKRLRKKRKRKKKKAQEMPRARWLKPVILATEESEIRRIEIWSQPGQIVQETLSREKKKKKKKNHIKKKPARANSSRKPYLRKNHHKKRAGGVAQGWALSSSPSTPKNKKINKMPRDTKFQDHLGYKWLFLNVTSNVVK